MSSRNEPSVKAIYEVSCKSAPGKRKVSLARLLGSVFESVVGELLGFSRGHDGADKLREFMIISCRACCWNGLETH